MTEPAEGPHPATGSKRGVNTTLWVLQVLAACVFVAAGYAKVTSAEQSVELFNNMGIGDLGRYAVGILELAGAVAVLIPRLCGLAALAFVGLMMGAITTQAVLEPPAVVTPLVTLVLVATIAWGRRDRTAALISLVTRR